MKNTSALILSGGKSQRMGFPKAFLKFNEEQTFIEKIASEFINFGCEKIIIVMNNDNISHINSVNPEILSKIETVVNPNPESGRFSSIKTGLEKLKDSENVFIHNIDNPFVCRETLELLYKNFNNCDFCVPVFENKGGHPIIIGKNIIKDSFNQLSDTNLKEFLRDFKRIIKFH